MNRLLLLMALCTFATAMVPRLRRAIDEEQGTTSTVKPICHASTPCGWVFYKEHPDHIDSITDNDYCQCASNMICDVDEDDKPAKSLIKKCKLES